MSRSSKPTLRLFEDGGACEARAAARFTIHSIIPTRSKGEGVVIKLACNRAFPHSALSARDGDHLPNIGNTTSLNGPAFSRHLWWQIIVSPGKTLLSQCISHKHLNGRETNQRVLVKKLLGD